jgi:RNA polymerase sigma-70 factor (ECF subfamily)
MGDGKHPAVEAERLWKAFHQQLLFFVRKRVTSTEDAEDLVQEVFARIHENAHRLSELESVSGWVYRIARNVVVDYHRRRTAADRATAAMSEAAAAVDARSAERAPNGDSEPSRPAEELVRCLRPLLERLPERYRTALELIELGGLTQKQAAQRMGVSLSGCKSRVGRGRTRLKGLLLDCCHVQLDRRGGIIGYQRKASRRACQCA